MLNVEQKSHDAIIDAPTHVITRPAALGRSFVRRFVRAKPAEARRSELLHGVAADDAVLRLFERYDAFDSMARDAADRRPRSK
jgi:hypothetical protein